MSETSVISDVLAASAIREPRRLARKIISPGLALAVRAMPSRTKRELAERLNFTPQYLSSWREVPMRHVIHIEQVTGVPRHKLRPDLWPEPVVAA